MEIKTIETDIASNNKPESLECYRCDNDNLFLFQNKIALSLVADYGKADINGILYDSVKKFVERGREDNPPYYLLYAESTNQMFKNYNEWFIKNNFNRESAFEFIKQWDIERVNAQKPPLQAGKEQKKTGR